METQPDPATDALFQRLYREAPAAAAQSLQAFRRAHPPERLIHDGADWAYICTGDGEQALLFLHGMAGAYDIWWQQIEALSDRYRIVSLTYPAVSTLEALRSGINRVLAAAGIARFNLVGSSLGGYLAQYLIARDPKRVLRAVFGNTFPPNTILPRRTRGADTLIRILPQALLMAGMRWNARLSLYPASGRSELLKAYLLEGTYRSMDKARFLARYRAVVEWFDPPDPEALGIPVLILESANDPLIGGELQRLLREAYPAARVHTFGAVGHFPYLNQPRAYAEALEQWLSLPAGGG